MKKIKCVIWDLDNTLWDGVLLEGDCLTLKPGIRDILNTLDSRGILMSIASKNDFNSAIDQLSKFNIEHFFLFPEINFNAKSNSVASIQKNLNIGMDTILFIDDQEFELEEVKAEHPLVTIVKAERYLDFISMECLNPTVITKDSARRRLMYLEEHRRNTDEKEFKGPSGEFMAGLNMEFHIKRACEEDLMRAEELTIRTNQLNSTGILYSYDDLYQLLNSPDYHVWICELSDKYGSYGKIGLALVKNCEKVWTIKLLLMSCRVVSRGVGSVMLSFIMNEAKKNNKSLKADFLRTDRNRQMLLTYRLSNFKEQFVSGNTMVFENDLEFIQEYPPYVKIIID